jgi:hypothetical protein
MRYLAQLAPAVAAFNFVASPALDLQPLFLQNGSWIGADIATSTPINAAGTRSLWLFGDTVLGSMNASGVRSISAMPRNSVGVIDVQGGVPSDGLSHTWRYNASEPVHVGFFSPSNLSSWYWPTGAAYASSTVFIVAYEVAPDPSSPLFSFQTVGMHILSWNESDLVSNDPLDWPVPSVCAIPHMNNTFTIGNAIAIALDEDGSGARFVYLMGASGNPGQGIMGRWLLSDMMACSTDSIQYWAASSGGGPSWQAWSPSMQPVLLFEFAPSETTLQYHSALQQWFFLTANTFISHDILISTAPKLTGPWSGATPLYSLPASDWDQGTFCYAAKSHPELTTSQSQRPRDSQPANAAGDFSLGEIVFTYNCNTPNLTSLATRPDMYFPKPVRALVYP